MLFFYALGIFFQYWFATCLAFFILLTTAFLILKPLPLFDYSLVIATLPFVGTVVLPIATFCAIVLVAFILGEKELHLFNQLYTQASRATTAAVLAGVVFATLLYGVLVTDVGPRSRSLFKHLISQKVVDVVRTLPAGEQRTLGSLVWYKYGERLLMVFNNKESDFFLMATPGAEGESLVLAASDVVIENSSWKAMLTSPEVSVSFGAEVVKNEGRQRQHILINIFFTLMFFVISLGLWFMGSRMHRPLVTLFFIAVTLALIHYALLTYMLSLKTLIL